MTVRMYTYVVGHWTMFMYISPTYMYLDLDTSLEQETSIHVEEDCKC